VLKTGVVRERLVRKTVGRRWPRIPWPKLPKGKGKEGEERLPEGTVMWQQGFIKKVIPPPWSGIKPYSKYSPVSKGEGMPSKTFRIIGGSAPTWDIDLGVVDIETKEDTVLFKGRGLGTNVGKRDPSRTKGMSIRKKPAQFVRMGV